MISQHQQAVCFGAFGWLSASVGCRLRQFDHQNRARGTTRTSVKVRLLGGGMIISSQNSVDTRKNSTRGSPQKTESRSRVKQTKAVKAASIHTQQLTTNPLLLLLHNAYSLGPPQRRSLLRPHSPPLPLHPRGLIQIQPCHKSSTNHYQTSIKQYEKSQKSRWC